MISTPTIEGFKDLKVANLMAPTTFARDYVLLKELLCAHNVDDISHIPLTGHI